MKSIEATSQNPLVAVYENLQSIEFKREAFTVDQAELVKACKELRHIVRKVENKESKLTFDLLKTLAKVVSIVKENASHDPNDFLSAVEKAWQTLVDYYKGKLTEKDLLTLAEVPFSWFGNAEYGLMLLDDFSKISGSESHEIHLSISNTGIKPEEWQALYNLSSFENLERHLKSIPFSNIKLIRTKPKPAEWRENTFILNFSLPDAPTKEQLEQIQLQIQQGNWSNCLPYLVSMQRGPWELIKPTFDAKTWTRIEQEDSPGAVTLPNYLSLMASQEKAVKQELLELEKSSLGCATLLNTALSHLTDPKVSDSTNLVFPPKVRGRGLFAVKFGNVVLCINCGGKGSGTALLFEKNSNGMIESMIFDLARHPSLKLEEIIPIPRDLFNPSATLVLGNSDGLETLNTVRQIAPIREILTRAILGKNPPNQSVIQQINAVTSKIGQEIPQKTDTTRSVAPAKKTAPLPPVTRLELPSAPEVPKEVPRTAPVSQQRQEPPKPQYIIINTFEQMSRLEIDKKSEFQTCLIDVCKRFADEIKRLQNVRIGSTVAQEKIAVIQSYEKEVFQNFKHTLENPKLDETTSKNLSVIMLDKWLKNQSNYEKTLKKERHPLGLLRASGVLTVLLLPLIAAAVGWVVGGFSAKKAREYGAIFTPRSFGLFSQTRSKEEISSAINRLKDDPISPKK